MVRGLLFINISRSDKFLLTPDSHVIRSYVIVKASNVLLNSYSHATNIVTCDAYNR